MQTTDYRALDTVLGVMAKRGLCRPVIRAVRSGPRPAYQSSFEEKGGRKVKVQDMMVTDVKSCSTNTNLAEAARIMWSADCGALPVLGGNGKVAGVITDRDIAMAMGTRNQPPSALTVFDVKPNPRELYTCVPEDDIHDALRTMRQQGIRRLPVVNSGELRGMLCLNEITLKASKRGDISFDDVVDTLKAIAEHRAARDIIAA
jgi:CBS domain-containing protein